MIYWSVPKHEVSNVMQELLDSRIPFSVRYRGGNVLVGVKQSIEQSVKAVMFSYVKAWEGVEDV